MRKRKRLVPDDVSPAPAQSVKPPYPLLFTPGQIGALRLDNRVVKASMMTSLGRPDATVSERLVRHYRYVAAGGVGLVMSEYVYVDTDRSKGANCQLGITSDEHAISLAQLAEAIQAEGAKAGIQLVHTGRQRELVAPPPKAPSVVPWKHAEVPEELSVAEIEEIVRSFGDAARRSALAGFDLIEIHAAHGYLISEFLSPHTNRRVDDYGGSAENRRRFLLEVIRSVRDSTPADVPLTIRINCTDYRTDGIPIEETVAACREAEALGVSAVHVSGGDHETGYMQWSPMQIDHLPHRWALGPMSAALSIPVIASGSIVTPDRAEELLSEGVADFVALARPLLADPHWPRKAREGRAVDIRPCIRCNDGCVDRSFVRRLRSITCTVNPAAGGFTWTTASVPLHVAVVGAGPAGLISAITLADKGHDVDLYERRLLGGLLNEATIDEYKADLRAYLLWLIREIRARTRISVLEEDAGRRVIERRGYACVVVATGGARAALTVPVTGSPVVRDALELRSDECMGRAVAIVGADYAGVEAALRMKRGGARAVTIFAPGDVALDRCEEMEAAAYARLLESAGVEIRTSSPVALIEDRAVIAGERRFPADVIGVALGSVASAPLARDLEPLSGLRVLTVGDAERPGKVFDAVHSAYMLARRI